MARGNDGPTAKRGLSWALGMLLAAVLIFCSGQNCQAKGVEQDLPSAEFGQYNAKDIVLQISDETIPKANGKIGGPLQSLVAQAKAGSGLDRAATVQTMITQGVYRPGPSGGLKAESAAEDDGQVFVYIYTKPGSGLGDATSLVQSVTDQDNKAGITAAWVKVSQLEKLAEQGVVSYIDGVCPPVCYTGTVTSEGDSIHRADLFRNTNSVDGTGIKIGIISDGANSCAEAIASNNLPALAADGGTLHVLSDGVGGDEGTAMLEIVHDLAPGAELYFHDCGNNVVAFNEAITELADAGCNVICDDIGWITQPFFEDGTVANHVQDILDSRNIVYISSAGNAANKHYQGTFYPYNTYSHDFSAGRSSYRGLYAQVGAGSTIRVVLQWNDQFGAVQNDYDLYLYNPSTGDILKASATYQPEDSSDPLEWLSWKNSSSSAVDVGILVKKYSGVAKVLEVYIYGAPTYTNNITAADSIFGQPAVPGAIAAGAINADDTDAIAAYSSRGPVTHFNPTETRKKPDVCGIDGVAISGAGHFYNPFYGTSAAAPHLAAIAALYWSQNPTWTASRVRNEVTSRATDLGTAGFDYIFGNGLADCQTTSSWTDLAISSVDAPVAGAPGNAIAVTDVVNNPSTKTSGKASLIKYYFSADTDISSSDILIGQRTVPIIPAGGNNKGAVNLTIPAAVPAGTYYLGAILDPDGAINELQEDNNVAFDASAIIVATPPYKDLVVSSFDGPAKAATGGKATVTDIVKNNGSGATSGTFTVNYYLSADNTITTADTKLGSRSISTPLIAGGTNKGTTPLTIPSTVADGTYYLGAIADSTGVIAESDENNNVLCDVDGLEVKAPFRDLVVGAIDGPETGVTGSTITVANTITNNGNSDAVASIVKFYASTDTEITATDALLGQRSVPILAPGASSSISTTLTIPLTAPGGDCYIGAIADAGSQVVESNENNNTLCDVDGITITAPDLSLDAVNGPPLGVTGTRITVTDTVKNISTVPSKACIVKYYLSDDNTITADDRLLGQRSLAALAAGASNNGTATLTIPTTVPAATYYLGAIADATSQVGELSEANNIKCSDNQIVIEVPYKDLQMTVVDGPAAAATVGTVTVANTVKNAGNTAATAFNVSFYLSLDSEITKTDKLIGQRAVSTLAAGASNAVNSTLTLPSGVAAGTYYVGAIADSALRVVESDENNNTGCDTDGIVLTPPWRDLVISSIEAPDTCETGSSITVANTVTNNGNSAATASVLKLYLSSDTDIDGATLLGQRNVLSVPAGASSNDNTILTIPAATAVGDYYVIAIADAGGQVVESNENNNSGYDAGKITITAPYVDLVIDSITGPASGSLGSSITVANTVTNDGTLSAAASVMKFYLSSNTEFDGDDILLGQRNVPTLAAGASSSVNTAVTIPKTTAVGNYYIVAVVDALSRIVESNENNNTGYDAGGITVGAPDIVMTSVDGPDTGKIGTAIAVSSQVDNPSSIATKTFVIRYFLSTDAAITTTDRYIGQRSISALAAGATNNGSINITLPTNIVAGTYYLGAIADATNLVAESNEDNNVVCDTAPIVIGS